MQKNIAILTMSLNIGGAETHIFELSCALAAKGHNVTVFSAGGVYADKLELHGVKHIKAPLDRKDPKSLIKAYRLIDNYVKNNSPCVIHSHTRISNLTADIIAKKYNMPLVTTVHFNFTTGVLQKLFTRWGNRAIAVSEDLKTYTTENYGFEKDKVTVTVNGINLNTFCKNRMPEFKESLGFEKDSKIILCVSRLDEIAGDHVYKVLCMAEDIYKNDNNTNILIIGGGTRLEEFREKAENINAKTKPGFIKLEGPQTDIYRYCNIADLFIGISRSALEAMACEVPTILLGNSGYIGLFSEKTEEVCIDTNFTCRKCSYPKDSEIIELIHDMLAHADKYAQNVADGYEIVKNRYSVARMAQDALDAYENAYKDVRPYDVMICGYYGRHNLGDDIALESITENFKNKCDVNKIALITADSKHSPHNNIDTFIYRFNLPRIYKYLKKTRAFILGGGSILQDSTSSRSLYYYLFVIKKAMKYGCRTMLYSNGMGPINKEGHKNKTVELIEKTDAITMRDEKSLIYLRSLGVKNENVHVTADETFTLDKEVEKNTILNGLCEKYVCINLRESDISEKFMNELASVIDGIFQKYGYTPVLLPMHYEQDIPVLAHISKKLTCKHVLIRKVLSHNQTLSILNGCEFMIVERLHAIIFSCIYNKPFLAVNYDPKILSFCIEMGMKDYIIGLASLNKEKVFAQIDNIVNNKDKIISSISERVEQKRELAKKNAEIAKYILN